MPKIKIDGIEFEAPEKWTVLEAARFLGLEIPTLCYHEGLSPWGGCRLCVVEIGVGELHYTVASNTCWTIAKIENFPNLSRGQHCRISLCLPQFTAGAGWRVIRSPKSTSILQRRSSVSST